MTRKNTILILASIILVVALISGFSMINKITWHTVKEIPEKDWLVDNCDCIERENLKCRDGWELVGRLCVKEDLFTNVLLGCSKYNCTGEIYEVSE